MTIHNEIIKVLNNEGLRFENKLNELRKIREHRRGNNRIVVQIIILFLNEYELPINNREFNNGKKIFRDYNEKVYEILQKVLTGSKNVLFNAVCSEALFYHCKELKFVEQAIKSYFYELLLPTKEDNHSKIKHLLGICRLFSKIGVKYIDSERFKEICIEFINEKKDENYVPLFLLEALREINEYRVFYNDKITELIAYFDKENNYQKSIDYRESFIEDNKDKKKVKEIKWEIVELKKQQADKFDWNDSANSFTIIRIIQEAMSLLAQINDDKAKEERKKLAKKIEPVKELSLNEIKTVSTGKIDISHIIEDFKKQIEGATLEEAFKLFMLKTSIVGVEYCKKELCDKSILSDLFPSTVLDSKGRTICVVPTAATAKGDEIIHQYEYKAMQYYDFFADAYYARFLNIFTQKYRIEKDDLRFLVEDNLFVPSNRKESFLIGIESGFRYDFITALHILMPQVENSIRSLAEELGAVVYKTADNGTVECLSFESVLNLPEIIEVFDEDFIFNLKVHYTSEYGFGMRNFISHGLYDDCLLNSSNGLAVWWYTLYLCCKYSYNLKIRLMEIKEKKRDL